MAPLISIILNALIPFTLRYFLAAIPLLPYTGKWISNPDQSVMTTNVSQSYFEGLLVLGLFLVWLKSPVKDTTSKRLLWVAWSSIPGLFSINSLDALSIGLFLFLTLVCGPGVYHLFQKHMDYILRKHVVDMTVLTWSVLSVFNKFYMAYMVYGSDPLFTRHGGIWASNHSAIIEVLLLPLVSNPFVFWSAIVVLILHFSRGVYLVLVIYAALWFLLVNKKSALKAVAAVALAAVLLSLSFPAVFDLIAGGIQDRLKAGNLWAKGSVAAAMTEEVVEDDRYIIHQKALEISAITQFRGIGLGGFVYGLPRVGFPPDYSNAHNLYLTALAEGGIPLFIAVIVLMGSTLLRSFRLDKRMFVGFACFAIYGYYSGELYNASGQITSGDYYYVMFVLAYLSHLVKSKEQATVETLPEETSPEPEPAVT